MKIINSLQMNGKQIKNFAFENLTEAPITGLVAGRPYLNTTNNIIYVYAGGGWKQISDQTMTAEQILTALKTVDTNDSGLNADTLDGYQATAFYLATTPLNSITAPTGDLAMNSQKITNLGTPTANSTDAATTAYVDSKVQSVVNGLDPKESVWVATTEPIDLLTIGANVTIDDAFVPSGVRVLVKNQNADPTQNGIYISSVGAWSRTADATYNGTLGNGAYVFVEKGVQKGTGWVYDNALGTFSKFSEQTVISAGTGISVSTTGGTSTVSIDTAVVARKVSADVGGATEVTINHGLGTEDVTVSLREKSGTKQFVLADVEIVDSNNVKFTFDEAPSAAQYRATIIG